MAVQLKLLNHHNVGVYQKMVKLIEPKDLFKDEVRKVGYELNTIKF